MQQPTAATTAAAIPHAQIPKSGCRASKSASHTTSHTRLTNIKAPRNARNPASSIRDHDHLVVGRPTADDSLI